MKADKAKDLVVEKLTTVAPEIEGEEIEPDTSFRDQFELDSMDFLNFITALHDATGLDFPEEDYDQLWTLNGAADYIVAHTGD